MEHEQTEEQMPWWNVILSGGMLVIGLLSPYLGLDFVEKPQFLLAWYLLAFAFVGLPVMKEAWE